MADTTPTLNIEDLVGAVSGALDNPDLRGKAAKLGSIAQDLKVRLAAAEEAQSKASGILSFVPAQYRQLANIAVFAAAMMGSGGVGSILTPSTPAELPPTVVQAFEDSTKRMDELSSKRHKLIIRQKSTGKVLAEQEF